MKMNILIRLYNNRYTRIKTRTTIASYVRTLTNISLAGVDFKAISPKLPALLGAILQTNV